MDLQLKDKVIILGGASGGIGTVVQKTLEGYGAKIETFDKRDGFDLSDPKAVEKIFSDLRKQHSSIYGYCSLVYSGIEGKPFLDATPDDFETELSGTLKAAWYPVQAAARWMKETGGGHIVLVSSINSILGLNESTYDAAKGALNTIVRNLATGYGKDGIYATALCPGTVGGTPSWQGKENELREVAKSIPDKKVTDAREIAEFIAFLLSPHAEIANGSVIIADRGWSLRPKGWRE